jgi:repressor LexA
MNNLPELTPRQREVFEFIEDKIEEWGYPPTIREIGEHLGIRSTNGVADHLKALKRKGYLTQRGSKSRTLIPTRPDTSSNEDASTSNAVRALIPNSGNTISIPILGRCAAGEPILAEEHAEGSLKVDSFLVGGGKKVFALKIVGDSMIDDGIFDGDYIFVQKRQTAQSGDIIVVIIDNEATCKRYYPEKNKIRLQPANKSMDPIYIHRKDFRDVQIIGAVTGVYRKLPD